MRSQKLEVELEGSRFSEHASNVVACLSLPGVGNAWIHKNLNRPKSVEEIVFALNKSSKALPGHTAESFEALRSGVTTRLEREMESNENLVVLGEAGFPLVRGEVPAGDQPVAIFYIGNLDLIRDERLCVAVVGLLTPDAETLSDEATIVAKFVERGAVIVSGLALGCDTQAHAVALKEGGKTVAILPSTLRRIVPAENRQLANQIVETGGLLITEYSAEPENALAQRSRFVRRDRLQALFSDLVVLAASYADNDMGLDSGSRHALAAAFKYGIPRAVLPDRSTTGASPKYDLNRELLNSDPTVTKLDPAIAMSMTLEVKSAKQLFAEAEPLFS